MEGEIDKTERERVQAEAVSIYTKTNPHRGCLVLSTGLGKSKVIIDIIAKMNIPHVLILANSKDIRDNVWSNEFAKWGHEKFYTYKVMTATYQAAKNMTKETVDLSKYFVVLDEVDFMADTDVLENFFFNFPTVKMIGITGYISIKKRTWFDKNLPVLMEYSSNNAQASGALNTMHYTFVKYELGSMKTIEVNYKDKSTGLKKVFKTSESESYVYTEKKIRGMYAAQATHRENRIALDPATFAKGEAKLVKQIEYAIMNRNRLLQNLESSAQLAREIVAAVLEDEENKVVVFSVLTAQSGKICKSVYNGTNTDKKNTEVFSTFNSSKIRSIGVSSKIDRGVTIDGLNTLVFESFYGSDTIATQRIGRGLRLPPEQTAHAYVFLPYYREMNDKGEYILKPTAQVEWARKAFKHLDTSNNSVIDKRFL